jgi:hypothetical protein
MIFRSGKKFPLFLSVLNLSCIDIEYLLLEYGFIQSKLSLSGINQKREWNRRIDI